MAEKFRRDDPLTSDVAPDGVFGGEMVRWTASSFAASNR
ncbi:hypothetical protein GGD83_000764 [Rhodoblastus sphagnicola]|nr:hypothetical protein [Rhodoblastus sphagnicola]